MSDNENCSFNKDRLDVDENSESNNTSGPEIEVEIECENMEIDIDSNIADDIGDDIVDDIGDDIVDDNIMSMGEIEKLSQKIHRYIKQHKFSDAHLRYIIHLCRLEDDHYNETKTGVHLNLGKYSNETTLKLKEFVEQCEFSWKQDENDEQTLKKKDRENQTVDFFKKRTDEVAEIDEKPKGKQMVIQNDSNQNQASAMINFGVDNKKIPLNKYKGIFQRIMRKSRAIKNFRPILNHEKKRTTDTLIIGQSFVSIEVENDIDENEYDEDEEVDNEEVEEIEDDVEEVEEIEDDVEEVEEEEDEDIDEEEEEEDEVSSIEDDDSDDFKDSDSSKELDRGDLDDLAERYN